MNKKVAATLASLSLLFLNAVPVWAAPASRTFNLPPTADNSPVISLGTAKDPKSGKLVEGNAIIHFKDNAARSSAAKSGKNQCYGFLASGAKWKTVEPWLVNGANTRGLDPTFISNNLSLDIAKWEDAADGVVGNSAGIDILGSGSLTSDVLTVDTASPDGQNEVYFADISTSGAIAVTTVWGIFGGPVSQRVLVEWDQVYDDVDFDWSSSGEAGKMDFENIATHELGHSVGMADLYNLSCADQTMFGYANYGETKKQTLENGDISGVNQLY